MVGAIGIPGEGQAGAGWERSSIRTFMDSESFQNGSQPFPRGPRSSAPALERLTAELVCRCASSRAWYFATRFAAAEEPVLDLAGPGGRARSAIVVSSFRLAAVADHAG